MAAMRSLSGPRLTRASSIVLHLAAIIIGALTSLLGAVTHAGGIDGGSTGLTVALLTAFAGSLAFFLLGGLTAYLCYAGAATIVPIALLAGLIGRGDMLGAAGQGYAPLWLWGTPAVLLVGGLVAFGASAWMTRKLSEVHMGGGEPIIPRPHANRYDVREHEKR